MVRCPAIRRIAVGVMLLVLGGSDGLRAEEGAKSLFNGKDLTGWKGNLDHWSVKDGAITGTTTPEKTLSHNTFLIWQDGMPADFELTLKYKMVGGNSGIQYRSKVLDEKEFIVGGYQADIDSGTRYSGINYEERGRGILADRGQGVRINADGSKDVIRTFGDRDELQRKIKSEDWNDYRIVAKGNHLQHYINGVLMSEVIDEQKDKAASSGVLALQLHVGPPMVVQFKDIELKELR